jgi:peroxiredoxin Q/BCP
VTYFMASTDSPEDNRGFAEKNDASFPILSDVGGAVSARYGVLSESGMARRWTFYIDPDGIISRIDQSVNPRTAGEALVRNLNELGAPTASAGP